MDPLLNLVWGVGTVAVASAVALIVGRRRGLDQVETRTDAEIGKLVAAQSARLVLQEGEIARLTAAVAALSAKVSALEAEMAAKVAALTAELEAERRITGRIRQDPP